MKGAFLAVVSLILAGISFDARSEEPDLSRLRCPVASAEQVQTDYLHNHEAPVVGSTQPTEIMTDKLTVLARDAKTLCFGLVTLARNGHMCGLMGVAQSKTDGAFLYEEGDVALRLTVLSDSRIQVSPVGEGYRSHCGMHGLIEDAIYERSWPAKGRTTSSNEGLIDLPSDGRFIAPTSFASEITRQCSRPTPNKIETFWRPTEAQIDVLEAKLVAFVRSRASDQSPPQGVSYHRQYVGFTKKGRSFIYGNFYPGDNPLTQSDRNEPVGVCDGGPYFWGVVFDLESGEFSELEFNGVA